jgi:hypothetical protein
LKTAKSKRKSLRIRALSVCLVAMLALPAAAVAMPRDPTVALRQENGFPLTPIRHTPSTPPTVHVIHTITTSSGNTTLPTVLAAVALAIALTGAAYVTLRLRPMPRSS